jgi:hypothetical protein
LALATSIVASGNYEDDDDNGETLVYTGQGANDLLGNRKQIGDQKLVAGNLALNVGIFPTCESKNISPDLPRCFSKCM